MRRTSLLLATVAALALALTPTLADARAGGGSSMGSRGARTYSAPAPTTTAPGTAQPMQRSMAAPQASPGLGSSGMGPTAPARSGFMSGLMGGLIGAGLAGMLFGGGMFGGMSGFGGFLGFLLQIFLVVIAVRFLFRLFRPAQPATAGGPSLFARGGPPMGAAPMGGAVGGMPAGGGRPAAPPVSIAPADYQGFEQLLKGVQAAWTAHDLNALRALSTPEMLSYFSEQLADQASRGVRNSVTDVRLQQGDLSEAWAEQGREYATVAMKFSMIDVTTDAAGRVVDGSPSEHVTATELWTFVRSQGGGNWILSAIQQVR
jgi:predicted lipid-binding transport protein (Tim44 family)